MSCECGSPCNVFPDCPARVADIMTTDPLDKASIYAESDPIALKLVFESRSADDAARDVIAIAAELVSMRQRLTEIRNAADHTRLKGVPEGVSDAELLLAAADQIDRSVMGGLNSYTVAVRVLRAVAALLGAGEPS